MGHLQKARNAHIQLLHTEPRSEAGKKIAHRSLGSIPQGGMVKSCSRHCCLSHCRNSVLDIPSQSRMCHWWLVDVQGRSSHSHCGVHRAHHGAQSLLHTGSLRSKGMGRAPLAHPDFHKSVGMLWCTHQSGCFLGMAGLERGERRQYQPLQI